jgi:segregation and condensation protein A
LASPEFSTRQNRRRSASILALAEQFVAALEQLGDRVAIERKADWLIMATRLVLLRSRLLFPVSPAAAEAAQRDAAA